MDGGAVVNAQGRVVSRNASFMTILSRALGFYPTVASASNRVIAASHRYTAYGKRLKAERIAAYMKAAVVGDRRQMNEIVRDANEWNREVGRNSTLYMSQFEQSARKAAKSALETALVRYRKTTPLSSRQDFDSYARIMDVWREFD